MKQSWKKWLMFAARWGVAVGGIWWVVAHMKLEDIKSMLKGADPLLIWASVLVIPVIYVITGARWNALLRVLGIELTQSRTFVLNMVGCFYNTFMPGSMGGDVLKAYYAAKQTPHKTHAVLSVLIDRVLGLLALIIMGGSMAAVRYWGAAQRQDPAALACGRIALASAAILLATIVGVGVMAQGSLRRTLGVDWLLSKLPMQKHVQHGIAVMRAYRDKPMAMLAAMLVTFPVHVTVVVSAWLAGKAFGLPLPPGYYFVIVPVIVLAGALPISPQGLGVQEVLAQALTSQYGMQGSQVLALTMSIRLVQIVWNLAGGIFVLRGGYHKPSESEQEELEKEEELEASEDLK